MEESPSWEANRFSASQEIPPILWNPKFHYRSHKSPSPVPILNQFDLVHIPTSHFLKIHLNIILPSMPGSPKWSLSSRFPHQNPVYASPLPHTRYMPRPYHSSRFYHPHNIRSMPGSPNCSLSFRFPHQNPVYASPLPHTRYMPRPSHSSRFYHPHNIRWVLQIIKLLIICKLCIYIKNYALI